MVEPKTKRAPLPSYNDFAREARLEGAVNLRIVIDDKGKVQRIDIVRPLGLGLDERAVESVIAVGL